MSRYSKTMKILVMSSGLLCASPLMSFNNPAGKTAKPSGTSETKQGIESIIGPSDETLAKTIRDYSTYDTSMNTVTIDNTLESDQTKPQEKKPAVTYHGLEVDSLKTYINVKLVGVDQSVIQYYNSNNTLSMYHAKNLLFELSTGGLVNLISCDEPFYVGQRYDIKYHPFKKGVVVDGEKMIHVFLSGNLKAAIAGYDYSETYDGILKEGILNRRK